MNIRINVTAAVLLSVLSLPCATIAAPSPAISARRLHAATDTPLIVTVDASKEQVNVMGRTNPKIPAMPNLAVKPNIVRGYVYDSHGKPLKGAVIGVRSSSAGGFYSGASAKTDAKGYYEVRAPWGAAHFYCAGYVMDYGDGIAALGLHPADGDTDSFATSTGVVKNWVLLPYGVADRAGVQENPHYSGNYYGGTVILNYNTDSDNSTALSAGSTIELTLTPQGSLIDGSPARTIVIRRPVKETLLGSLYINNIPITEYKVSAKIAETGAELHMKETGMYSGQAFGLDPKEATGEATMLLKAGDPKANMVTAAHGNWTEFQITLSRG